MDLLSPQQIRSAGSKISADQRERVRKINDEETQSVNRLNVQLDKESKEIAASKLRLKQYKEDQKELEKELSKEVMLLERRKANALEPIIEREKAVEKLEAKIDVKVKLIAAIEDDLRTRTAEMRVAKNEYESKLKILNVREEAIAARERKHLEDVNDFDRNANARESRLRDEDKRIRVYFEKIDGELTKREIAVRKKETK